MKTKLLFTFCFMFMFSLFVQTYAQFEMKRGKVLAPTSIENPQTDGNKLIYSLSGNEVEGVAAVNADTEERAYLCIPAKQWKGCKITNVEIGFAYSAGENSYIFISKDLNAEPMVRQSFQCDTISAPDDDSFIGWKNIPLDEPYTIESDEDLFIGLYTIQQTEWDGVIGTDWNDPVPGANMTCYRRPNATE